MMHLVRHIFASVIAVMILLTVNAFLKYWMPTIEGTLFPVAEVTSYSIEKVDGKVLIWGTQEKTRDCDIESVDAAIVDPLGIRADARRKKSDQIIVREEGTFNWGPWEFDTDIETIKKELVITTIHSCHPFWFTKSVYLDVRNADHYQPSK